MFVFVANYVVKLSPKILSLVFLVYSNAKGEKL